MDHDLITGQWIGSVSGQNNGRVIIEADVIEEMMYIDIYFYDAEASNPNFFARFSTNAAKQISKTVRINPFDKTGSEVSSYNFATLFPGVQYDPELPLHLEFDQNLVRIRAESRDGVTIGTASRRSNEQIIGASNQRAELVTWAQFKSQVSLLPLRSQIFRGQGQPWPLRTSFHRTKRSLIYEYVSDDVRHLSHAFSNLKPQFLNLRDPVVFLSFLSFLQHHGYPTPLLDWTYSPYIASYFAALDNKTNTSTKQNLRVFLFDWAGWNANFPSIDQFVFKNLHFTPMSAFPIENERAVSQQSVFSMTNLSDIEDYLYSCEDLVGRKFLRIFDISHTERDKILDDLEMMGITAASLFPGPEGICRAERRRRFDTYK